MRKQLWINLVWGRLLIHTKAWRCEHTEPHDFVHKRHAFASKRWKVCGCTVPQLCVMRRDLFWIYCTHPRHIAPRTQGVKFCIGNCLRTPVGHTKSGVKCFGFNMPGCVKKEGFMVPLWNNPCPKVQSLMGSWRISGDGEQGSVTGFFLLPYFAEFDFWCQIPLFAISWYSPRPHERLYGGLSE